MARPIIVLAFVAVLCISLTLAASTAVEQKKVEISPFLNKLSTRQGAGCLLALQQIATSFGTVVTQFSSLQTIVPDLFFQALNCVFVSGTNPSGIGPCLQNVIPTETAKIQTSISGITTGLQALVTQSQQLLGQCLGGLAATG